MKIAFLLKGYYRLDNNNQLGIRFTFTGHNMQYHFLYDAMDNFYKNIYIYL